ncbi:hypothetical protein FOCC_FOCC000635 [Frankliniella occidentalis]|uniref:Uncharacterized protein LOC113203656 isoform X1 n=1 Tax=Frankliniella occidentalis TaxID=133901 RepID=A0A6J1RZ84_FRAOC|nr:uncharacterized protein LOC113203656 isoform X1 [Frankliniella occidentalis]KAE8752513.1 hypothetical protein FOCC_FOCC000635 [Frankliniella occidentalis]
MRTLLVAILTVVAVVAAAAAAGSEDFCSRCDTSGLRYRLVRGAAEAGACDTGVYCDCDRGREERCFLWVLGRRFNEEAQRCEFNFDCHAWLDDNNTTGLKRG